MAGLAACCHPSLPGPPMLYDSIVDTIGRTPIVRLQRLAPAHVTLHAKVEAFNPGGSVKDRLAIAIILDAEARGALKPGDTVVEATSGNTGSRWRWSARRDRKRVVEGRVSVRVELGGR